jgi:hypothetical protein
MSTHELRLYQASRVSVTPVSYSTRPTIVFATAATSTPDNVIAPARQKSNITLNRATGGKRWIRTDTGKDDNESRQTMFEHEEQRERDE